MGDIGLDDISITDGHCSGACYVSYIFLEDKYSN